MPKTVLLRIFFKKDETILELSTLIERAQENGYRLCGEEQVRLLSRPKKAASKRFLIFPGTIINGSVIAIQNCGTILVPLSHGFESSSSVAIAVF